MDRIWKTKIKNLTNLLHPHQAAEDALRAQAYAALEEACHFHDPTTKSWVPEDKA